MDRLKTAVLGIAALGALSASLPSQAHGRNNPGWEGHPRHGHLRPGHHAQGHIHGYRRVPVIVPAPVYVPAPHVLYGPPVRIAPPALYWEPGIRVNIGLRF